MFILNPNTLARKRREEHLYHCASGWAQAGTRQEQQTDLSRVGIELIGNIDALPDAPANYWAPNWKTTDRREIELSQNQANLYDKLKS